MLGWAFCFFVCVFFVFSKEMNSLIAGVPRVSKIFLSSINRDSNGIQSRGIQRWNKSQGDLSDCYYKMSPRPCRAVEDQKRQSDGPFLRLQAGAWLLSRQQLRSSHSPFPLSPALFGFLTLSLFLLETLFSLLLHFLGLFALSCTFCASCLIISSSISPC